MADKGTYKVKFRRRREGKTNYAKRLKLLRSGLPRLVARVSNTRLLAGVLEYNRKGDKSLVQVSSTVLKKFGWNYSKKNISAAYLTGYLCGLKAKKQGVNNAVLDIGIVTPVLGSKIFAVLKGAIDAGLKIPASEDAFPKMERIEGEHIQNYASSKGKDMSKFKEVFDSVKDSIQKSFEGA